MNIGAKASNIFTVLLQPFNFSNMTYQLELPCYWHSECFVLINLKLVTISQLQKEKVIIHPNINTLNLREFYTNSTLNILTVT